MKFENSPSQSEPSETSASKPQSGPFGKLGQKLKNALAFAGLAGALAGGEMQAAETVKLAKPKSADAVPVIILKKPKVDPNAQVYRYDQKTWLPKTPEEEQARQEALKRLLDESSTRAEDLRKDVNQQEPTAPESKEKSPSTGQVGTYRPTFSSGRRKTNSVNVRSSNYGGTQDSGTYGPKFNSRRGR